MDDAWLETVRLARDCGDISSLFPEGINRLWDLPFTLANAIGFALRVLSWQENLPKEELPPKHIWLDEAKMTTWWRNVEENRESKNQGKGDFMSMPENAYVKELFGRSMG